MAKSAFFLGAVVFNKRSEVGITKGLARLSRSLGHYFWLEPGWLFFFFFSLPTIYRLYYGPYQYPSLLFASCFLYLLYNIFFYHQYK